MKCMIIINNTKCLTKTAVAREQIRIKNKLRARAIEKESKMKTARIRQKKP